VQTMLLIWWMRGALLGVLGTRRTVHSCVMRDCAGKIRRASYGTVRLLAIRLWGDYRGIAHLVGKYKHHRTGCTGELRPVITRGAHAINELFAGDAER
jgi:hypothetical protein